MSEPTPTVQLQIPPRWVAVVDEEKLEAAIHATLRAEGILPPAELSLVLAEDEEMVRLNRTFRQAEYPTDVLTFPYDGEGPDEEMETYLGDVVVGIEQAARQADEEGHALGDELQLLAVHGTLHLLGYDDESPAEQEAMWARQRAIMEELGLAQIAPRV